ncbi:MAG TPA: hypothetical protein VGY55_19335 [Pirellulales bacterium]|jgi:hypothetical protein|nr:hypothetical protein [Pirellulales bacterium]
MKIAAWFVYLNIVGLLAVAIWFRCRDLANIPGVNGDEAWYGVQAELILHGRPIAWRTPTGNLLNPLFFGPQLLLHALCEPSFALLRTTAVASGLAALAVNFWLCRSVFGRRVALISTTILAVLPISIVYSRLAWDASQSLLITLPAIYLPLRAIIDAPRKVRWSACGLAALTAAIIVHPTNLFVAPIVGVCLALAWRDAMSTISRRLLGKLGFSIAAIGFVAAGAAAGSYSPAVLGRFTNPTEYAAFGVNLGRLFSGATVYDYVSGAVAPAKDGMFPSEVILYDLPTSIAFCSLAWGIYRLLRRGSGFRDGSADNAEHLVNSHDWINRRKIAVTGLTVGWGLSLAAFFLVAGPAAIAPHFERYGICLIGAGAILAALSVDWWLDRPAGGRVAATTIAVATGWLLLAVCHASFFNFMETSGGRSHPTFRTAAIEPKEAAFDFIVGHSKKPGSDVRVLTSEWWNYWPLRYLSFGEQRAPESPKIVVEQYTELPNFISSDSYRGNRTWIVEFAESPACEAVRRWGRTCPAQIEVTTILDFSGQPLLCIFRVGATVEADQSFNAEPSATAITRRAVADGFGLKGGDRPWTAMQKLQKN